MAVGTPGFNSLFKLYQKTSKNRIHSFPACTQHEKDGVEKKPARSLVLSFSETLNGIPPSLCGKPVVGPHSLGVTMAHFDERLHVEHKLKKQEVSIRFCIHALLNGIY